MSSRRQTLPPLLPQFAIAPLAPYIELSCCS